MNPYSYLGNTLFDRKIIWCKFVRNLLMNYYVLFYKTIDDYIEQRIPFREEHLALASKAQKDGSLVMAGALAEPADGALLVFKGSSPEVAASFAENDPYVKNGLITEWSVRPWTVVIGGT